MKILLGVTGCIAAYKSCEILRALQKLGANCEVVMTEAATKFISPLTFDALSGTKTRISNFNDASDPIPHVRMAEECDLFLIAPCTANTLSKIACGMADDLMTSCALVAHDKLAIAPAMNVHMYEAPSTQESISILRSRGVLIIEPDEGYLACGEIGAGRLAEVDHIAQVSIEAIKSSINAVDSSASDPLRNHDCSLEGKKVVITAGPTRERIDPVRFITNDSSGKMGIAIANAALRKGAEVTLILGPVFMRPDDGVQVMYVESSVDMYEAVDKLFDDCDVAIFSAAVCDIKPRVEYDRKLKKGKDGLSLSSIETENAIDILKSFASRKGDTYVVGFAAETENVIEEGRRKLVSKEADMIIANKVGRGETFGKDESKAWIIAPSKEVELEYMPKWKLANIILDEVCANMS